MKFMIQKMVLAAMLALHVAGPALPVLAEGEAEMTEMPIQVYANGIQMFRLYNPNSGEHFYTANSAERDNLKAAGWRYEGLGWTAPASGDPVYRLYNPNAGDHHYTMNAAERDMLVKAGWNYEQVGWYSDTGKSAPLYRSYNPNAKAGSHNYTIDNGEYKMLEGAGWKSEGIAWYGLASSYNDVASSKPAQTPSLGTYNPKDTYLINTHTGKFHFQSCSAGQKTAAEHRSSSSDRNAVVKAGYSPCQICKP